MAILVIACLFCISGCSVARYGYDNADWLAQYWAARHVTLDDDQAWLLRERARALLEWHRTTQLHREIGLVREVHERLRGSEPVTVDEVLAFNRRLLVPLRAISAKAAPDLADLALSLRDGQIDEMESELERKNREFREKYLDGTLEEQRERNQERILDRAEFWFGRFDAAQRATIRAAIDARPMHYQLWLDERRARQRELLALLRRIARDRPQRETAAVWIQAYLASLEASADPEREMQFVALRRSTAELTAFIVNQATAEQKSRADKRLLRLIEAFESIAAQP